jgi:maleate isomerase
MHGDSRNNGIRVGLLTPHAVSGAETDLSEMAPGRVVTCIGRVLLGDGANPGSADGLRALAGEPLDEAAAMFERGSVAVIAYASTTTAYALGYEAERALVARLSLRLGVPVVAAGASAVLALHVLDVDRVALVHPPWFDSELEDLGVAYFQGQGLRVVSSAAVELSRDPRRIDAKSVYEWVSPRVPREAEAVFIGGTGFRTVGAIEALEARLRRPVLTANQVLLWNVLAQAAAGDEVVGYGELFAQPASRTAMANSGS